MNYLLLNTGKLLDFQTISQMYQDNITLDNTNTSVNLGTLTFNLNSPGNMIALSGIVNYNLSINVPDVTTAVIGPLSLTITRNGDITTGTTVYSSFAQYTNRSMLTNDTEYDSGQFIPFEFVDTPPVTSCDLTVTYTLTLSVPSLLTPGVEYQLIRNEIYYSFSGAEIQQ
ncbi:hypothetical protein Z959_12395 [Clostridium novyi B str. ATCC 27606]|uniref:Uncharacterized protein n=2 Tax=Clostridium TaxID=1485 RepID=A0AA40M5M9_CLONO|nr:MULTISPECIES: hypothetical protein [Clostridium]KEI13966.1 hypothetical protein Z958_01710 [Clostridium novyi B str. NCTC 9691]KEI15600.1 hypothetical protein Z959_12395 [Clostridium novyi B str. ATCC 27606]KEI17839.1 hypothetical protein Z960_05175 [Clostridium haemolyticum NCTC 9693]KGN03806.1 hypothetical protein Z961_06260 [Clostridium haemolyticum NCTC 8350]OOB75851.1 hypothetical protein AXF41_00450 [Clostridium haemolyticum]